jgi:putative ABC transport system permease protein
MALLRPMTFLQDLRYSFRLLLRSPGFTLVAVLTLALGIGANTAIFTVVNALLLRPLPYADPDRLVFVWQDLRARGGPADEWATPGNYVDWRRETGIFEQLAVIAGWRATLTGGAEAEAIPGEQVSHEYFSVLGVTPVLGRTFAQTDDVPNARRVAVMGHGLWTRRFGSDPSIVGRTITLNAEPHEIIGVLPEGFRPIISTEAQLWRPARLNTASPARGAVVLRVIARLADGVSHEQAQSAADTLAKRLEALHPEFNEQVGIALMALQDRVVGAFRPGLLALLGAVAFVLLIACANIANLLLARGSSRGRELAVRTALGAGRSRVLRQLLTESLLLAAFGGIAGVALGIWAVDALVAVAPANAPRLAEIRLDPAVFGFAALLTCVTGVLFGIAPALTAIKGDVILPLKGGMRGSAGSSGNVMRRVLIAAEMALALMLLTGGGLLLQTFLHLQAADLGFNPERVVVGFINPPRAAYDSAAKYRAFYDQVLERAAAIPAVEKAALASVLPLSGDSDTNFAIEGRPPSASPSDSPVTWYRLVSAEYFDVMGMTLRAGRAFVDREPAPSTVVNETFARRYFAGENPIGRRIRFGGDDDPWFTIVGIIADARARGAREAPRIEVYVPYWQQTESGTYVLLKTSAPLGPMSAALKQVVSSLDRNVPLATVSTLADMVGESIEQPRFFAMLSVAFALLALTLAAIGIYGVMAYAVSQRTGEIGVRMALGATPTEVFRLVVGDGLRLALAGVVVGVAGSLLVARWLTTLLFGIQAGDPATFIATAALLLTVAGLASYVPARRAARVDPMEALRVQ